MLIPEALLEPSYVTKTCCHWFSLSGVLVFTLIALVGQALMMCTATPLPLPIRSKPR